MKPLPQVLGPRLELGRSYEGTADFKSAASTGFATRAKLLAYMAYSGSWEVHKRRANGPRTYLTGAYCSRPAVLDQNPQTPKQRSKGRQSMSALAVYRLYQEDKEHESGSVPCPLLALEQGEAHRCQAPLAAPPYRPEATRSLRPGG